MDELVLKSQEAFRNNLRYLMESHGYNTNTLSIDSGISNPAISRYLTGNRNPEFSYVIRLADFFGVSIDWLCGIDDDKYSKIPTDLSELLTLYEIATDDDKHVIRTILGKYKNKK